MCTGMFIALSIAASNWKQPIKSRVELNCSLFIQCTEQSDVLLQPTTGTCLVKEIRYTHCVIPVI